MSLNKRTKPDFLIFSDESGQWNEGDYFVRSFFILTEIEYEKLKYNWSCFVKENEGFKDINELKWSIVKNNKTILSIFDGIEYHCQTYCLSVDDYKKEERLKEFMQYIEDGPFYVGCGPMRNLFEEKAKLAIQRVYITEYYEGGMFMSICCSLGENPTFFSDSSIPRSVKLTTATFVVDTPQQLSFKDWRELILNDESGFIFEVIGNGGIVERDSKEEFGIQIADVIAGCQRCVLAGDKEVLPLFNKYFESKYLYEPKTSRTTDTVSADETSTDQDILKVTKLPDRTGDSYAVLGAINVPYTCFTLSTGNKDVFLQDIHVRQVGSAYPQPFAGISLVGENGLQVARVEAETFDIYSDEIRFCIKTTLSKNTSHSFAITGDVLDDHTKVGSGEIGFEITKVVANTKVHGNFPISGALHVFASAITLQRIKVSFNGNKFSLKVSSESFAANKEDMYLRFITLEFQDGISEEEIVEIKVRGEKYRMIVRNGVYSALFPQKGFFIKHNEKIKMSVSSSDGRSLTISKIHRVYVVGAKYGYGLPYDISKDRFFTLKNLL